MNIEKENEPCVLCSSTSFTLGNRGVLDFEYGATGSWDYWQCTECGLQIISPTPDVAKLKEAYPKTYHAYHIHHSLLSQIMKKRFWMKKAQRYSKYLVPGKRILEVGCSFGDLLVQFKALGFGLLKGIDFNSMVVEKARKRGLDVEVGELENVSLQKGEFDMIIMENYIEHVNNPVEIFSLCNRLLQDKGYLVGETPNLKSWDYTLFEKYWGGYHSPRHLHLFNKDNISMLANREGFEVVRISDLLQPAHWALSVQNWIQNSPFRNKLKNGRSFYFPVLLILALPLNVFQLLCSQTSSIEFVLKKVRSV